MTGPGFFAPTLPFEAASQEIRQASSWTVNNPVRPPTIPTVPPLPPHHPMPCLPPPGYCRHPRPLDGDREVTAPPVSISIPTRTAAPLDSSLIPRSTDPYPIQHLTENPPIPSIMITSPTPPSPPTYLPLSPPKYCPISSSHEQTLLLAPPPSFTESTNRCRACDLETARHSHWHSCSRGRGADWVKWVLILMNVVVWILVLWGYWVEWNWAHPDGSGGPCGAWGVGMADGTLGGTWPGVTGAGAVQREAVGEGAGPGVWRICSGWGRGG